MDQGTWVLVAVLAAATAFGLFRAATDGRFRGTHRIHDPQVATNEATRERDETEARPDPGAAARPATDGTASVKPLQDLELRSELGERATLLQFSSAFCAPCRATRRVLDDVASVLPGVSHVEVDAEHHLELVRRLGIVRTPTTLVLDGSGREVTRATGAPRKEDVLRALAQVL